MIELNKENLNRLQTPKGGWTKDTTTKLGVKWPLKEGWKQNLILDNIQIEESLYNELIFLRNKKRGFVNKYNKEKSQMRLCTRPCHCHCDTPLPLPSLLD